MNRIETIEVLYFCDSEGEGKIYKSIKINSIKKKKKKRGGSVGTLSRYIKKNALSFVWIENTYSKRLKKCKVLHVNKKIHIQNDWNIDDLLYTNNLRYDLLNKYSAGISTDAENKMVIEKY